MCEMLENLIWDKMNEINREPWEDELSKISKGNI